MDLTISNALVESQIINVDEENRKNDKNEIYNNNFITELSLEPLVNSSTSLTQLWRIVKEQLTELSNSLSNSTKESSDTKKSLIDLQKETQIKTLKEREAQIEKQNKSNQAMNIFSKIAMALGFLAAIIMAPFNPVMSAIMIGGMVASMVIPAIVDKILEATGVEQGIRDKVKMGLEIGLGLVTMLAGVNPASIIKNIGNAATSLVKNAALLGQKAAAAAKSMISTLANLNWASLIQAAGKISQQAASKMQLLSSKVQDILSNLVSTIKTLISQSVSSMKNTGMSVVSKIKELTLKAQDALASLKNKIAQLMQNLGNKASTAAASIKENLRILMDKLSNSSSLLNKLTNSIKKQTDTLIKLVTESATKAINMMKTLSSMSPAEALNGLKNLFDKLQSKLINISTNYSKKSAAKLSQITTLSSTGSDIISTGFGINSSSIKKDLDIFESRSEEILATIAAIMQLIEKAMDTLQNSIANLIKVNQHFQDFRHSNTKI